MSRREWCGAVCEGERSRTAIRSWFKLIVTDDWEGPLKADIQSDIETDRTTAIRALFKTPGGQLREAYRRFGVRTSTFGTRPPTSAILAGFTLPAENSAGVRAISPQGNLPPAEPHDTSTKGGV